jgi:hypothetical protein
MTKAYHIFDDLSNLLASLPPRRVLDFTPSSEAQERLHFLLKKNQSATLTLEEEQEFERYMILEHIIRVAKIRAVAKSKRKSDAHI